MQNAVNVVNKLYEDYKGFTPVDEKGSAHPSLAKKGLSHAK